MLPASWPAALKGVEEAAGAPVPLLGAATRRVEEETVAVDEIRAEEDFLGVGAEVMVGVEVEVTSVVVVVLVGALVVVVVVDVGVWVVEIATGIQFRSSGPRVPEGVAVPAEAWQEA
jgi:hypothetical protein